MASRDFSSIKSPLKFDGLNFPIWKMKMTFFLKSLRLELQRPLQRNL